MLQTKKVKKTPVHCSWNTCKAFENGIVVDEKLVKGIEVCNGLGGCMYKDLWFTEYEGKEDKENES